MATCPECDAEIEVDEFDVDKGDQLSCPECGSSLEVVGLIEILIIEIIVVFVVFIGREIEFDGRETSHLEARAAFRAAQLIALVDVELVDLDFGIAFRAGGHGLLGACGPASRVGK